MATKRKANREAKPKAKASRPKPGTRNLTTRSQRISNEVSMVRDGKRGSYTALGYRAVESARRDGRSASAGNGDYHIRYDRIDLIGQSRAFYRDNGLYRGLVDRAVTNIIQSGFGLQMRSDSDHYNKYIESRWTEFAKKPEARGMFSFLDIEIMFMREVLMTGDTGAIKINKGKKKNKLQLIESERITHNQLGSTGVDLDAEGQPTRFHVANYGPRGQLNRSKATKYAAADFVFLAVLDRSSQTRGVPACQASFAMLHRIMDICDSESLAWQALSRMAIAITNEGAGENALSTSSEDPDRTADELDDDLSRRLHELDYALIYHGKPGDKVEGISRNIPGSNFTESLRTFLRLMGLPLGLPLELVLLDWSQSNYSSSRASLEQAFQVFAGNQNKLEEGLHKPTLLWQVDRWVKEYHTEYPRRKLPANYEKHEWIEPSFPWIDQLKEAQAWATKLDRGLTTHGRACKSLNCDRDEMMDAREAEVADALTRAARLQDKFGVPVPWQIFAGLEPPTVRKKNDPEEIEDLPPDPPPAKEKPKPKPGSRKKAT